MAKVTKHHSGLERVALFIGGIGFGFYTLVLVASYDGSGTSQAAIALFGLCSLGGFYGALVGKQSM